MGGRTGNIFKGQAETNVELFLKKVTNPKKFMLLKKLEYGQEAGDPEAL